MTGETVGAVIETSAVTRGGRKALWASCYYRCSAAYVNGEQQQQQQRRFTVAEVTADAVPQHVMR